MSIIETILLRALLNFLIIGSFAGLIVGAILIFRPQWLERASLFSSRWISTRQLDKKLENTINIDSWFYRYRSASGVLTLAGVIYVLYFFNVQIDKVSALAGLAKRFQAPTAYIGALFDPLVLIALLGATFALFASLLMLFRPSLLHKFERGANEWISLRRAMKPLEISHNGVDEFTFSHTRQMGVLLVLSGVYSLALLTFWAR